jgi:hypothetical protein
LNFSGSFASSGAAPLTIANTGGAATGIVTFRGDGFGGPITAINNPTTINAGATLALASSGAVPTGALTVNGTFDISQQGPGFTPISTLAGSGAVRLGGNVSIPARAYSPVSSPTAASTMRAAARSRFSAAPRR